MVAAALTYRRPRHSAPWLRHQPAALKGYEEILGWTWLGRRARCPLWHDTLRMAAVAIKGDNTSERSTGTGPAPAPQGTGRGRKGAFFSSLLGWRLLAEGLAWSG